MLHQIVPTLSPSSLGQQADPSSPPLTDKPERILLGTGFLLVLALKLIYPFTLRFSLDEPQHLHVVWGWANGFLQYRDVFDNHTPLFHLLFTPLFWALGERADIAIPMRMAMLPLFGLTLWCVFKISCALYSKRTALWTALLTAVVPVYFFTSSQFRTDDLWVAFWMLSLLCLLTGKSGRPFWTGFFLGCAFATSMKTSLLLASLLLAGVSVGVFRLIAKREMNWKPAMKGLSAALAGIVLVPALIVGFFYFKGAIHDFYYCVIEHNMLPGMSRSRNIYNLRFPIAFPILLAIGYWLFRGDPARGLRRALLFMTAGIYVAILRSYWPLVTPQDYLPFVPLCCLAATPLLLWGLDRSTTAVLRLGAPAILVAALLALCLKLNPPWHHNARAQINLTQDVLNLSEPGETIMDGKGETIFRRRAFYYALEEITVKRMLKGLIPNTIVQELVAGKIALIHEFRLGRIKAAFHG